MTRYADPERCPDCLSRMPYGTGRCPSCGLSLEGPLAAQLFATLSTADDILTAMRETSAQPVAAPAAPGRATTTAGAGGGVETLLRPPTTTAGVPGPPGGGEAAPPPAEPARLRGTSVPKILLGLGALCLLVAALVFLAVTWSAMGVAGRTAALLGFTAVAAGLSAWAARRELRAAAESLCVVALGLLVFDMFGARNADWLGDVSLSAFLVELGVVLALVGSAAAVAVRRTPVRSLVGAEVFATLGVACAAAGTIGAEWLAWSAAVTLAVVLTALVAVAARAARLNVMSAGAALLSGLTWLLLAFSSWDRATANASLGELWGGLEVWPLLAAAGLVGVLALVARLPLGVRVAALAVSLLVLAGVVLAPVVDETATDLQAAGAAVVVALSVAGWFAPQPWRRSLGAVAGLGLVWTSVATVFLAVEGLERLVEAGTPPWAGGGGDSFPVRVVGTWESASWLLPVLVVATTCAIVAVARSFAWADRVVAPLLDLHLLVGAGAAAVVLTLALYPVPMWLVTGAVLAAGVGFTADSLKRQRAVPLGLAAAFLALALVLGLHAAWLTLPTLGILLVAAAAVHLRCPSLEVSVGAGAVASWATAGLVWTIGWLAEVPGEWSAVAAVLVLAALVLVGPYVDERVRLSGPSTYARLGTEAGSLVSAGAVSVAGVEAAASASEPTWAAVYLTLVGAATCAMALLRPDRRVLGWLGGLLLAVASWVRLADLGVDAPEAYTLPSAVALLVVGLVQLRKNPRAGTMAALTPGLALALVPSLLWVVADPVPLRSALLGAGCLALVLGGVRLRWSAPVVHGAVVGAVLVVRLAVPVFEGIPQWVLIGAAGVVLVATGITWEKRVRDARALAGYVRRLR